MVEELGEHLTDSDPAAASRLQRAASLEEPDHIALLEMRSALISTRGAWERHISGELVAVARSGIAAAKRLAIDLLG